MLSHGVDTEPSVRRGNGVQGSADPGEPTALMQPQTKPIDRQRVSVQPREVA